MKVTIRLKLIGVLAGVLFAGTIASFTVLSMISRSVAQLNLVIAREDVQLNWLRDAITDLGGTLDEVAEPAIEAAAKGAELQAQLIREDGDAAQSFVDRWRPRMDALPNARHRSMLRVILGETLEHRRFFQQALAGRSDLLGRRADGAGTGGGVLGVRWIER